jgi:hypothetical protein
MKIKLAFTSEKDLEKRPATFLMLSSFPDAEISFGLGARRRTFNFASELVQALEPAHFSPGFLRQLEIGLEHGKDALEEVSAEQAASIGMLPAKRELCRRGSCIVPPRKLVLPSRSKRPKCASNV